MRRGATTVLWLTALALSASARAEALALQPLIDAAPTGSTVLVGPGTYQAPVTFSGRDVTLRSTDGPAVTIIEGDPGTAPNGPIVSIGPDGGLIGFTIRNGRATLGAGMRVYGAGSLIQGNVFEDNTTPDGGGGAGIYAYIGSPRIEGNVFRRNSCSSGLSAGVLSFNNASSPAILNNVFEDNACRAIAIAVTLGSTPVVVNNTIVRNPTGIYLDRRNNSSLHVYANNALVANGVAFRVASGTEANNPTWKNNLLFANTNDYAGIASQTGTNGNVVTDPLFIESAAGDYHLNPGSPAIDAGFNGAPQLPVFDYDGEKRVRDGDGDPAVVIDIGADEFSPRNRKPVANPGQALTAECGGGATVTVLLDGSLSTDPDSSPGRNDDIDAFDWFEDFGLPSETALGSGAQLPAPFGGGMHHVTLRVTDTGGLTGAAPLTVDVRGQDDCDDGNPCTEDAVTSTCGCTHTPTPERPCDDGDKCTTPGLCSPAGVCVGAAPVDCNDNRSCSVDTCNPATGCVHSMVEGAPCDDGNDCTTGDTCGAFGCVGVRAPDNTICESHEACRTGGVCAFGFCQAGALPSGTACDDGNACTTGERCSAGSCVVSLPFHDPTGLPVANVAGPVSIADFNLDGAPDLLAQRSNDASTLVLLSGNGSGGFVESGTLSFPAGSYATVHAVSDFNLDGKPDFVAVKAASPQSTIFTFLGNGTGGVTAAPGSPTPGERGVSALVVGDFNSDAKPDLAVASGSTDKLTILLGDGSGGFAPGIPVGAGPNPEALAIGDFNEDGNLDVATGNPQSPPAGVAILLGNGAGGLSPYTLYPVGNGAPSIAVADLDRDGHVDLVATDTWSTKLWILRGLGNGAFAAAYGIDASADTYSVAVADLNLDTQLDLITGSSSTNRIQVLAGKGTWYARPFDSPVLVTGSRARIALADFDRDGRLDVLASTWSPTEVRILLNRSQGNACPSIGGCATNTCNRETGQCSPVAKLPGSACTDHNVCTTNDACINGWCQGPGVSGLACDDGSGCTTGDACEEGACSGALVSPPQEVGSDVLLARSGSGASVTWRLAPGATSSSVLRGKLVSLPVGASPGDQMCLAARLPAVTTSTLDGEVPQGGSGFWYLVRGENACMSGGYGYQEQGGVPVVRREDIGTCP